MINIQLKDSINIVPKKSFKAQNNQLVFIEKKIYINSGHSSYHFVHLGSMYLYELPIYGSSV